MTQQKTECRAPGAEMPPEVKDLIVERGQRATLDISEVCFVKVKHARLNNVMPLLYCAVVFLSRTEFTSQCLLYAC
jgi:hypothetical protein